MKTWKLYLLLLIAGIIPIFLSGQGTQSSSQQEDTSRILLDARQSNLKSVLKFASRRYDIRVAYDPKALEKVPISERFDVRGREKFIREVLEDTPYDYRTIGNTFVIVPRSKTQLEDSLRGKPFRKNVSIKGRIQDAQSGEPLPYATVSEVGTANSAITNPDGQFSLFNIRTDTSSILITYLGYQSKVLQLSPALVGAELEIGLSPRRSALPPVEVVSATNELIKMRKRSGALSMNPDQIRFMPGKGEPDLLSAMTTLSGISANDEISPGIRIRGDRSDQNLILLDGYTVYHIDHFFGVFSAFNPSAIKNVQLLKGPFDASYGGRAGGVLELTSKKGNIREPKVEVGLNPIAANAVVELPIVKNNASLMISGRRSITDFLITPTYRQLFSNVYNTSVPNSNLSENELFGSTNDPEFSFYDLQARFSYSPTQKDDITLSYYQGSDNLEIDLARTDQEPEFETSDNTSWGNNGGSIRWSRKWNEHYNSTLNLGMSIYESELDAVESRFYGSSDDPVRTIYQQESEVVDYTARFKNEYKFNSRHRSEFGAELSRYEVSNFARDQDAFRIDTSSSAELAAIYFQHYLELGPRWDFAPGMRVSKFSEWDQFLFAPKFNLGFDVNENVRLKGAYGVAYQALRRLAEQRLYLNTPEIWALSGPDGVPLLRSWQTTLGMEWKFGKWNIQADVFTKESTGTIDYPYPEFYSNQLNLDNMLMNGERETAGIELFAKRAVANFTGWAGYTFMESRTQYDDINFGDPFPSYQIGTHEFELNGLYRWRRWGISGTFVLATGSPYTQFDTDPQSLDDPLPKVNESRLPTYHRFDLAFTYNTRWQQADVEVGISIYNLYDQKNVNLVQYVDVPVEGDEVPDFTERDVLGIGITPSISARIEF